MDHTMLNCAVVDDSKLQRLSIVKLINEHPSLKLVAQYNSSDEAKYGLLSQQIDLVFLDIEMPRVSGFELLDNMTQKPQIIFVTGKTKYAFKAFDYDAIDYLRKPISKDRFFNAVHKAIVNYKLRNEEGFDDEDFIFVKLSKRASS